MQSAAQPAPENKPTIYACDDGLLVAGQLIKWKEIMRVRKLLKQQARERKVPRT
jgi:hypothetical protein